MAKGPTYDLSDAEKRDLVELIQAGKPLPEKYRFILFEDKREVEAFLPPSGQPLAPAPGLAGFAFVVCSHDPPNIHSLGRALRKSSSVDQRARS